jgi:hypothetical protein
MIPREILTKARQIELRANRNSFLPPSRALAAFASLMLLCSCASSHAVRLQLPAPVNLSQDAGRGNLLFVTLRLADGDELPSVLDTGSPGTLFDKSLVKKLGVRLPLGKWTVPMDGERQKSAVYWEPKLYLGGTRLKTGRLCATADFKMGFLARHLVTFDFPKRTMYLKQTSTGPLVNRAFAAAFEFLRNLKAAGQVPGWSKTDHGTIRLETRPRQETFEFAARKQGDSTVCHYTVTRASQDSPWKLQRAWRTDQNDKLIEEFPVP